MKIIATFLLFAAVYYLIHYADTGQAMAFILFSVLIDASAIIGVLTSEDGPRRLWFRSKKYGYGWSPVTIEGWLVTGVFVIFLTMTALLLDGQSHSGSDFIITALPFEALHIATMMAICTKTGDKAKWRWGSEKIDW